ncbi:Phage repressor protein C, contains Cro/C1-type HTH and peptisase s24 domains [Hymenobacter daecheongensis DSM 21074]|uniref:Phage repressor protein C, contains Cro/C1-type HTH and peptisase s24 domains n=1 Tax=Hymenobacter daecheongensis DSM 21074 TaxID=1121955 RepID=A0A1M6J1H4_9BACT|nr:LexA family transcriptional regulator [Hymenobacter daecheongensis]SHJ40489.1 Phage repressor protein C, contains Cro/C1-type HTH and peptisase s24 domains [Hymenobacter daecheongensis DSM 21074]
MTTVERKKISSVSPLPELSMAERLKVVRQARGLTQQQMADLLGISRPTVAQLEGGRHQPSTEVLETIVSELEVSRNWLWFGGGPMDDSGTGGGEVVVFGKFADADHIECPFIPVPVRAGFVELIAAEGDYGQYQTMRIYNPSPELRKAGTVVFEIDGDSMEPQLRAGMLVAVTPVPMADIKYIVSGVYVAAFGNQLTIKRIKDNDLLTKHQLVLHSDNPKAGMLTVAGEDIRGLWKVVDIIRGRVE